MDVIDLLGVPVHTTCAGRAEGPAVGVLAVSHRRAVAPHARLRLSEPRASFAGHASDVTGWAEEHRRQLDQFCARLAECSRLAADEVAEELRVGRWIGAEEALRLRLVDEIARPGADVRQLHGKRIGFRGQP
jgi:ATP-dependent protease ClpP protease subunit